MKKSIVLLFSLIVCISLYSQKKSKGFARWSIVPEYGYNMLDGDINQNLTSVFPTSFRDITYGGNIEYAMTPIWGLSLDYYYFPLKAKNQVPFPVKVNTYINTSSLNATINFTRFIFPETQSKFYLSGSIGVGFAYYKFHPIDPTTGMLSKWVLPDTVGANVSMSGTVPITFSFEYNVSKPLAIGLKVHYRAFTKDNLEGVQKLNSSGVTNDFVAAGTVYLRWKLGAMKRNHLRDTRWQDYSPAPGLTEAQDAKRQIAELSKKVNNIGGKVDTLGERMTNIENKVNKYESIIQNFQIYMTNEGIDSDGDGVPDVRDKEPNTPANTSVDFWGRTIQLPSGGGKTNVGMDVYNDLIPAVYFGFDKMDLDNRALETISKVALKMQSDSTLFVEVRGYCDYVGKDNYNRKLSSMRAERVKKELVKIWKIDPRRINANGNGRITSPPVMYRPNRRCDFYFNK